VKWANDEVRDPPRARVDHNIGELAEFAILTQYGAIQVESHRHWQA
jgi:hypothetical protein